MNGFKKVIFIGVQILFISTTLATARIQGNLYQEQNDLENRINHLKSKPKLVLPLDEEIELLKQLNTFDLGRFILRHGKLNGYWRSYFIYEGSTKKLTNQLEDWYVNKSPIALATRERFYIFQQEVKLQLQKYYRTELIKIASVPCGMMYDLLTIDYGDLANSIELIGIDLDPNLLKLTQTNSEVYKKQKISKFLPRDLWNLNIDEEFDIIVSHGPIIYAKDPKTVIDLYKGLYRSLRNGGTLITSFLTPPPNVSSDSPWQHYNKADLLKETALYKDITEFDANYYTEKQVRKYLEEVGFKVVKVVNDSRNIFPTIIAQK